MAVTSEKPLKKKKNSFQAILCIFTSTEHITGHQAENTTGHEISLALDVSTFGEWAILEVSSGIPR